MFTPLPAPLRLLLSRSLATLHSDMSGLPLASCYFIPLSRAPSFCTTVSICPASHCTWRRTLQRRAGGPGLESYWLPARTRMRTYIKMYYYCTVMIHSAGKYDVANHDCVPTDNSPLRMILDAWQIRVVFDSSTCLVRHSSGTL